MANFDKKKWVVVDLPNASKYDINTLNFYGSPDYKNQKLTLQN